MTPLSHWPRVMPAIVVDSAMLTAYFGGRLMGLSALGRRRPNQAAVSEIHLDPGVRSSIANESGVFARDGHVASSRGNQ